MKLARAQRMQQFHDLLDAMARAQAWADAADQPIEVVCYAPRPDTPPSYFATSLQLLFVKGEIIARAYPRSPGRAPRESTR